MIRTAPFVRRRRILVGAAIVGLTVATLVTATSKAQDTAKPAGTTTTSSAAVSKAGTLRAERAKTEAAKAQAARVEAARAEASRAKAARAANPAQVTLLPSDQTAFVRRERITGQLSPKSVVASPSGLVTAQNMMYTHTVSVFTPDGKLRQTVDDSVDLSQFGIGGHPGTSKGSPVEAAFTHDGKHVYVSNYSMYGKNFGPEGLDSCNPGSAPDKSFLYRIDTTTLKIDQVIPVGAVPKYVAVTPDDSTVLVTNWCSWTMSVVDVRTARLVHTIPIGGAYPRGIAITADSKTAFIAVMGSQRIAKVNLASRKVSTFAHTGNGPRHIVISPDGKYLYVTNNSSGTVSKVDARTGAVLKTVSTGQQPRSMAISRDGRAVYVVNYESSTVSKLRTSDLKQLTRTATDYHPIGIAYEPTTGSVWVACYGGSIMVFDDNKPAAS
ncbi:MAG TPA: YncE family protein [Dermatophilaceae bacterium]|jgi:YVTN family beta-propeller protein